MSNAIDLVNAGFLKKDVEQKPLDERTRNAIKKIIGLAPNRKEGHLFHAYAAYGDGLFEQALQELEKQQSITPNDQKITQVISVVKNNMRILKQK